MTLVVDLVGRERELAAIEQLLAAIQARGAAVLVRGEPGIGKSALLAEAARRACARDLRVLRTEGVASEAHLAFAGLHQLLRPVLADADDLPPPQREALLAAFGMSDAAAPDVFLIALAALELLSEVAAREPLLLVVEDAQWLDRSTADVLAFVARRLDAEPMMLLAAVREGAESGLDDAGLVALRLEPLDDGAAAALLDARAPDLEPAVRERILAEAAGNPLALVELPVASARLSDGAVLPRWMPLTTRLEQAFAARVCELPAATRAILLVAALDDGDAIAEVLAAAALMRGTEPTVADLEPAVAARLVDADGLTLSFRHPLVRSAIHQAAGVARRHAAHAALARVLADEPERRLWHRAAACVGPDEEVAAELEAAATRAQRRGGGAAAIAALDRAARLSADTDRRGARLLRAGAVAFELGRHDLAGDLLEEAEALGLGAAERARLAWFREIYEERLWSGAERLGTFVEMAEHMRDQGDVDLALGSLFTVAYRCWWSTPDRLTRERVVAAAERMPVGPQTPEIIAILALAEPVERGADVLARLAWVPPDRVADPIRAFQLGAAASAVGAHDVAGGFFSRSVAGLRAQGRLGVLVHALVSQAWSWIHLGTWHEAMLAAEEAARLARETSQPRWAVAARIAEATLAALRGDEATTEAVATEAERALLPMGATSMLALIQYARGVAAAGAGRRADAHDHLTRVFDPSDVAYHPHLRWWGVGDLVDAAVHCGRPAEARAVVAELEPLAATSGSPLLRAGLACARPLIASDDEADEAFAAALATDLTSWPAHRARLLLAHGAWLRRQRRVAESRAPLRAARESFDALGGVPWGRRAREELRAAGETTRRRTRDAWDELSPQELQIARLAADGLTNREIGERLYLSHRTIGTHLYRIFPKLGITSRAALRSALAEAA